MTEIACDESGHEGEKLVGGETDVFAHASTRLSVAAAAGVVAELRKRIRSPAQEYKANHLLRAKHRAVLVWFLGPASPIHGHADVHLVDKAFFLVSRIADGVVGSDRARTLYAEGRRVPDPERWARFLVAANDLMRTHSMQRPAAHFVPAVDALRADASGEVGEVLALLRSARPPAVVAGSRVPVLDLLVPAIVRAVLRWGDERAVTVVHDRHVTLTDARIAQVTALLGTRLRGVTPVESRHDPRVQVADFLAGIARKVASYELSGRGDPELVALLRPYVDPSSVWGDDRSWAELRSGPLPGAGC